MNLMSKLNAEQAKALINFINDNTIEDDSLVVTYNTIFKVPGFHDAYFNLSRPRDGKDGIKITLANHADEGSEVNLWIASSKLRRIRDNINKMLGHCGEE